MVAYCYYVFSGFALGLFIHVFPDFQLRLKTVPYFKDHRIMPHVYILRLPRHDEANCGTDKRPQNRYISALKVMEQVGVDE